MWIKTRSTIRLMKGGESLSRDDSCIRMHLLRPDGIDRNLKICSYVNADRAKEVLADFWKAAQEGKTTYEFPEV